MEIETKLSYEITQFQYINDFEEKVAEGRPGLDQPAARIIHMIVEKEYFGLKHPVLKAVAISYMSGDLDTARALVAAKATEEFAISMRDKTAYLIENATPYGGYSMGSCIKPGETLLETLLNRDSGLPERTTATGNLDSLILFLIMTALTARISSDMEWVFNRINLFYALRVQLAKDTAAEQGF